MLSWYVIIAGLQPGVCHDREQARAHLGLSPSRDLHIFSSESQAALFFTRLQRGGAVRFLEV